MGILDGKVAIITGSGRGIGKEVARKFIEEGAKVSINDIDPKPCKATAEELGENALACVADVTNEEQVEKMVEDTIGKFGKIDILVNCAGLTKDALIHKMSDFEMNLILDVNLKGTHVCTKAVVDRWLAEGGKDPNEFKKIVNFASTTGVSGNLGQANYAIAKAGNIAYTKSIARELSLDRVCCNVVAPGFIDTRMTQVKEPGSDMGIPAAVRKIAIGAIPFSREGKGGQTHHVADVLLFLSSHMSDWVTGQLLTIDGGAFI